jgi:uncharacterized membrane protein (UPF0127 family)
VFVLSYKQFSDKLLCMSTNKPKFFLIFCGLSLWSSISLPQSLVNDDEWPNAHLYLEGTQNCYYLKAIVAKTDATRQRGFMDPAPSIGAIIFEWPESAIRNFWMKGTSTPLALFRVDGSGTPQTYTKLEPFNLTDHVDPTPGGRWAVEIRRDWPIHVQLETLMSYRFIWTQDRHPAYEKCVELHKK